MAWGGGLLLLSAAAGASAAEPAPQSVTEEELRAWLEADPEQVDVDREASDLAAPALEARKRGWVIAGGVGALGHLGDMRHVSPIAPWFRLHLGYELFDWLMLLGEGDVALASTSYARRPPDTRSYAVYAIGAGARLAWQLGSAIGLYVQASGGLASVNEDVLASYGYRDADRFRPYGGGELGIEWYQVSPHYALAAHGGVRDYFQTFQRDNGQAPPLAWTSGLSLRYTP